MKKTNLLILLAIVFGGYTLSAQNEFITKWNLPGPNLTITIPTTGGGYNYDVDWGDGTITTGHVGNAVHTYATSADYFIEITGDFPRIYFNNSGDNLSNFWAVIQWGNNPWTSFRKAFKGCHALTIFDTDSPNLTNVTDCRSMFEGVHGNLEKIGNWDMSNMENLGSMFKSSSGVKELSGWDISNVTNMSNMFNQAGNIGEISNWDVSNVEIMVGMFRNNTLFNQNIDNWDVSNVTNMTSMFQNTFAFNQDISSWDVSKVIQMDSMFNETTFFNQDISSWDFGATTNMSYMFKDAVAFDTDVGNWDVSNVTNMEGMFENVNLSPHIYDRLLIGWNQQNLQPNVIFGGPNSTYCFSNSSRIHMVNSDGWTITDGGKDCTKAFVTTWQTTTPNEDIIIPITGSGYDYIIKWGDGIINTHRTGESSHTYNNPGIHTISLYGDFPRIFIDAASYKDKLLSIEQWGDNPWESMQKSFKGCSNLHVNATDIPDLSGVTDCQSMFMGASSFNEDISSWDMSNVQNFGAMFRSTSLFNQDLGSWDVSSSINMSNMFRDAIAFDQDIGNWDVSNVTNMSNMFNYVELSMGNYDNLLAGWSAQSLQSNVVFSAGTSRYCLSQDEKLDIETDFNWTITDGGEDCEASSFKVTYMTTYNNEEVTLLTTLPFLVSNIDITIYWGDGSSTDFYSSSPFVYPTHLYTNYGTYNISVIGNIPALSTPLGESNPHLISVDQWGSSQWVHLSSALSDCVNLVSIPSEAINLSHLNTKSIANMFKNSSSFNGNNVQNWDVSEMKYFSQMFKGATAFNVDLSNWNTSSAITFYEMFTDAILFNANISFWDVSNVTDTYQMFSNATSFDQDISSWDVSNVTIANYMFLNASSFNQNLGSWDIFNATCLDIFLGSGLTTSNYDLTIIGWFDQTPDCCIDIGSNTIEYCESWFERKTLIDDFGWSFNDGGEASSCTFNTEIRNTNNKGKSSLRRSIKYANTQISSILKFIIPGAPPYHINILTPLPDIEQIITLDGTTQTDVQIVSNALTPTFNILNAKTLTIKDLRLKTTNDASTSLINNNGMLIFDNVTIEDQRIVPKDIIINNSGASLIIKQELRLK